MRVNVYAEEMTDRVELIEKEIDGTTYVGLRFYMALPVTHTDKDGDTRNLRGPFIHKPGDDDSAAVTFWGKQALRGMMSQAFALLDEHERKVADDG